MDLRINETQGVLPTQQVANNAPVDDSFKFTLASTIEDKELSAVLKGYMDDIQALGEHIAKHMDIRDMKKYREKVKEFMNEIVNRSHKFSRENFLDRRGRHRVYGMIKLVDEKLDELASELLKDEKDHIGILNVIGEIEGMLIDIMT